MISCYVFIIAVNTRSGCFEKIKMMKIKTTSPRSEISIEGWLWMTSMVTNSRILVRVNPATNLHDKNKRSTHKSVIIIIF